MSKKKNRGLVIHSEIRTTHPSSRYGTDTQRYSDMLLGYAVEHRKH